MIKYAVVKTAHEILERTNFPSLQSTHNPANLDCPPSTLRMSTLRFVAGCLVVHIMRGSFLHIRPCASPRYELDCRHCMALRIVETVLAHGDALIDTDDDEVERNAYGHDHL